MGMTAAELAVRMSAAEFAEHVAEMNLTARERAEAVKTGR